jgi:hypothetical protein
MMAIEQFNRQSSTSEVWLEVEEAFVARLEGEERVKIIRQGL